MSHTNPIPPRPQILAVAVAILSGLCWAVMGKRGEATTQVPAMSPTAICCLYTAIYCWVVWGGNRVLLFITDCTFLGNCWVTKHCRVAGSYSFSFPAFGSMIAAMIACFVAWSAAKMWMPPLFSVASIARLFVPALLPLCCLNLLSYICYHICYHYMLSYMLSLYAITVCYHICYHYMLSYMLSLSCYLILDFIFPRWGEHSVT